jgi:hypothetical protein
LFFASGEEYTGGLPLDADAVVKALAVGDLRKETPQQYVTRMLQTDFFNLDPHWFMVDEKVTYCEPCFESLERCPVNDDCSHMIPDRSAVVEPSEEEIIEMVLTYNPATGSAPGVFNDFIRRVRWAESAEDLFDDTNDLWRSYHVTQEDYADLVHVRLFDIKNFSRNLRYWGSNRLFKADEERCREHEGWHECSECNGWHHEDNIYWVESGWTSSAMCERCVDIHASYCEDHDCYERNSNACLDDSGLVHDYGWRPETINFWELGSDGELHCETVSRDHSGYRSQSRKLFLGLELEVECGQGWTRDDIATHMDSEFHYGTLMFKTDSSLNHGLEIVTHPMTLEAFKSLPWAESLQALRSNGVRSWNTSTCGIHIHLSRSAFSGATHIWAFSQLLAQNPDEVIALAGRNSERYASLGDDFKEAIRDQAKGRHTPRYIGVNYQNRNTLEVRLFKGTLRLERVFGDVEFVHAAHAYSAGLTASSIIAGETSLKEAAKAGALRWAAFAAYILDNKTEYPNLITLLEEKSLLTVNQGAN